MCTYRKAEPYTLEPGHHAIPLSSYLSLQMSLPFNGNGGNRKQERQCICRAHNVFMNAEAHCAIKSYTLQ